MGIRADIQSLAPTALLDLFVLDTTNLPGGSVMRFHAGTNSLSEPVVWQGQTYEPMPIEAEGFDVTAKGALPRPKLRVANTNGFLSASVKSFNDFVGCKVTRKRTFAKYLDAANFPARRNLIKNSENLSSGWTANSGAVTHNATTPPLFTQSADKFVESATSSSHYLYQDTGVVAGLNYTSAIYAKAGERSILQITPSAGFAIGSYQNFDLSNGKLLSSAGGLSAGVEHITDGWYRCHLTDVANATTNGRFAFVLTKSDATTRLPSYQGDGASGLYLTGAQFENASAPSDYQAVGATWSANPYADPNQFIPDDLWYVERKVSENRYMIEFELSSAFDLMGQQLPSRQIIQNTCSWKYRGVECAWSGANYDKNNAASSAANDACAKTLAACKVRFGTQPIRFGGFPGAVRGTT